MKSLRPHLSQRRLLGGVALLVVLGAVAVVVADPFAGTAARHDSSPSTSIRRVQRTSLSSQTPVSGTLGYAGSWTVSIPSVNASGGAAIYTKLPSAGDVASRGQRLYAIDGQAVLLLYGSTPAWRVFHAGMSSGSDVGELNTNLRALGYGAPTGNRFTSATAAAISRLQRAHGLPETGTLLLGAVVFEPGPLRVMAVTPTVGQPVESGPLLTASSTRHSVTVQLDPAQQSQVKVGDRVVVTLPGNSTTPGVISSVGKVATFAASSQGGAASGPTLEVTVRLLHAAAAGTLDQAPVDVSITGVSVRNVLAVPVNALLALAGGGYAVEEIEAGGRHQLVAVRPGLFDDAQGLVEVSGNGLAAGQRVVVPAQ